MWDGHIKLVELIIDDKLCILDQVVNDLCIQNWTTNIWRIYLKRELLIAWSLEPRIFLDKQVIN